MRIEAAGGKVIQWKGYRVFGVLAMSRSLGRNLRALFGCGHLWWSTCTVLSLKFFCKINTLLYL